MRILAIDPGNTETAYVLMDEEYRPLKFGKVDNYQMRQLISDMETETLLSVFRADGPLKTVIEMVASYGMAVGKEVFETCVWIGRYTELTSHSEYIYRKDVKLNLCGQVRAKDSNVRQALIDRFGVVGTKKSPGFFYGFRSDIWSAYAVGVTYLDSEKEAAKGENIKKRN